MLNHDLIFDHTDLNAITDLANDHLTIYVLTAG
jgi:hypothetical protein